MLFAPGAELAQSPLVSVRPWMTLFGVSHRSTSASQYLSWCPFALPRTVYGLETNTIFRFKMWCSVWLGPPYTVLGLLVPSLGKCRIKSNMHYPYLVTSGSCAFGFAYSPLMLPGVAATSSPSLGWVPIKFSGKLCPLIFDSTTGSLVSQWNSWIYAQCSGS